MQNLALGQKKTRLAGLVKAATDDMQSLERDKAGLEKTKKKLEKSIADCEATIAKGNLTWTPMPVIRRRNLRK